MKFNCISSAQKLIRENNITLNEVRFKSPNKSLREIRTQMFVCCHGTSIILELRGPNHPVFKNNYDPPSIEQIYKNRDQGLIKREMGIVEANP